MAERKFELALQWIEEGGDIPDKVAEKIQNLYEGFAKASKSLSELGFVGKQNEVVFKGLQAQYRENYVEAAKGDIGFKLVSDTLDAQAAQAEATRKSWEKFGRGMRNTGVRLGWLGYRMSIVGRMLLRWMTQPIQKLIRILKDWDKTLGETAMTLGLLEYYGMGSATTLASLTDVLEKLPSVGLKFEAAMGALEAVWARIAVDIGPVLTDVIMQLADAFFEVWNAVSPTLIPVLKSLVDTVLPSLIGLIERVGPAFITNLVEGAGYTIGALVALLNALEPILPAIGWIIGALLPLAPLLIVIGTAAYLLSPILMALGSVISFLTSAAMLPLLPIILAVAAAVTAAAAVFFWLRDAIGPIPALIAALLTGLIVGIGVFYGVSAALTALGVGAVAATPGIAALGPVVGAAGAAATPAIPVILALALAALAVGAAFLMAGVGVKMACEGLVYLLTNLVALTPVIPQLFVCAAGLMAIAVAGWALIPAMFGLIGASAGLIAMSVGIMALAASIWVLVAAVKAYAAVADVAEGITGALSGAVNWLGGALSSLCFKHAIPMATEFGSVLDDTARQTQSLSEDVSDLGRGLRALPAAEVGVAAAGGAGSQYITIESPRIEIGNISSELDLDKVTDAVSKGIAEAARRRS